MTGNTSDTRSRIQAVALELFTEQGYEKTSLREVAERLGVTKAALYYHFKSKDEIVESFIADRIAAMTQTVEWARQQPAGPDTRRAIIDRYAEELTRGDQASVMRFFERNQPALKTFTSGLKMREHMFELIQVLAGPDAAPDDQLRVGLALFAIHSSWFVVRDPAITEEERRKAALTVAYELIDRID